MNNLTRREYLDHDNQETIDAIVGAGAIPMLVELVPEGPTERERDSKKPAGCCK